MTQTVLSRCCLAMATLLVFTAQRASDAPRINTVRVRNTELSYIDVGRGEPVILIHGALHDYRSWSPTWPELSKHYRVIAYSQRHNYPNPPLADGSQPSAVDAPPTSWHLSKRSLWRLRTSLAIRGVPTSG